MRSGGEEVEGYEDSEDSKDKEDGECEDDEWQHVCSDLTLFHTAQRVEDQIALAGHSLLLANNKKLSSQNEWIKYLSAMIKCTQIAFQGH